MTTAILIKDGIVVTSDTNFTIYSPGSILIEKDRIIDVGLTKDVLERNKQPFDVIDARGKLIAPGFVSVHNHLGYTLFRGRAEDVGPTPTPSLFLPMKQLIRKEDRVVFAELGAAELVRAGVTTVLEMEEDANIVAPQIEKIGLRAGIAIMTNDVDIPTLLEGKTVFDANIRKQQLQQTRELIETWHNRADGRLRTFVAANMALSCSAELLRELREIADHYQVGATCHIGLGQYEVDLVQELYHCRPFEFIKKVGFLQSDTIVAHCHYMDDADLNLLAKSGATVAHCPVLNSLRAASARVPDMLQKNIPIALGLDNYFADYFDVMRACIAVARVKSRDATLLTAKDVFRFATIDAAHAMGIGHETGSLEVGKKADLQIINLRKFGICPVTDPISSLVYHAHGHDVETVFIDGRLVLADGKVLAVDEDKLFDEAQALADNLWQQFANKYENNLKESNNAK